MPIHPAAPSLQLAQVDEEGAPMLDWGLAVEALNKVDAGVPEKVSKLWGMGGWCGVRWRGVPCVELLARWRPCAKRRRS